jgi:cytochrome P450
MQIMPTKEQRRDPYGFYATMRENQPVAYDDATDLWAVYRYDDVRTVLTDHATFSSAFRRRPNDRFPDHPMRTTLLGSDPPQHTQLRGLISRAFTPRAIANLEPRIREITNDLLDAVIPTGSMDLLADLAAPLPITVIAEMLGIPTADRQQFKRWSDAVIGALDTLTPDAGAGSNEATTRFQALDEMDAYFSDVVDERRAAPRDDLISRLATAAVDGARLAQEDILAFCSLLLIAGNITTTNLLGNALPLLLERPAELARLRAEPSLIPLAIEEVLRFESPVQATVRSTTRAVEIAGTTIPEGQRVLTWLASANRDPARFETPECFIIDRPSNPHVAFGSGIHYCLGAPLSRLEGRVALEVLLARLTDLERADAGPLPLNGGLILRGVARLPLRFTVAEPRLVAA